MLPIGSRARAEEATGIRRRAIPSAASRPPRRDWPTCECCGNWGTALIILLAGVDKSPQAKVIDEGLLLAANLSEQSR